jgi:Type II CAAX prenyl endopeptidase Rce1-like
VATAIWFGAAHLPTYDWNFVQAIVAIGLARIALSIAFIRTKNILVSFGAHLLNNWVTFTFVLVLGSLCRLAAEGPAQRAVTAEAASSAADTTNVSMNCSHPVNCNRSLTRHNGERRNQAGTPSDASVRFDALTSWFCPCVMAPAMHARSSASG